MIMFYFSGTGNSKYIAELFSKKMNSQCHSIEEKICFDTLIGENEVIAFCYPVYMSRVPRIMREFVYKHMKSLKGKKLIIFCTQWLLSGDGARTFTDLFARGYIETIYAEHFFMPDNVNNVFFLPVKNGKGIEKYKVKSELKIHKVCNDININKIKKRGFNVFSRFLGLFQGVFLSAVEKKANNYVGISDSCTNCGICVKICPMDNLALESKVITHKHNCTMCYRCINKCPKKAITVVFHGKVRKQYKGF